MGKVAKVSIFILLVVFTALTAVWFKVSDRVTGEGYRSYRAWENHAEVVQNPEDGLGNKHHGVIKSDGQDRHGPDESNSDSDFIERLSLLALFQTHDVNIASAVVLVDGYGAYRYAVGEEIGRFIIKDIKPDHLVLEGSTGLFRLFLVPLSGENAPTERLSEVIVDGSSVLEETRAQRERMRAFSTYDIYPVSENSADGYIIGERFPAEVLKASGAEPGDIIVSVNGYNVGDVSGDELALNSFRTTMKASVLIRRRDGSTFYFHYPDDAENP